MGFWESSKHKSILCRPHAFSDITMVAEVLGLKLTHLLLNNESIEIEYEKDGEYKYCVVGNIPKDNEFLKSAVWCSLVHLQLILKHKKLARIPFCERLIVLWCKLRYFVFNKVPDIDFEFIGGSIFPVLFADSKAEIVSDILKK